MKTEISLLLIFSAACLGKLEEEISQLYQEILNKSENLSFENHPCNRDCEVGDRKECFYNFIIDYEASVPNEVRPCPDGVKSLFLSVNYQSPGPTIEVCENDTVIVDVFNRLVEPTTIHWHGIRQEGTSNMDGVPFISQYPIEPCQVMRYQFNVTKAGTFWYHSHYRAQRYYGVNGAFIVRLPKDLNPYTYLYDVDNEILDINEWPDKNLLINGKGRNQSSKDINQDELAKFKVDEGTFYRYRLVFTGYSQCIVQVSIDNHTLIVIQSDGEDLQPIEVESILLTSGERYDFVLKANQPLGNYWLRVQGKDSDCKGLYQAALIQYKDDIPLTISPFDSYELNGVQLNSDFERNNDIDIPIYQARSLYMYPKDMENVSKTFYFHLTSKNNDSFMNNIKFKTNEMVSLLNITSQDLANFTCSREDMEKSQNCTTELCVCPQMVEFPYQKLVEIVVINDLKGTHPIHLHGYSFYVVGQGDLSSETDKMNAENIDKSNQFPRNIHFPPKKDTVLVHSNGYTIIRFFTNNPGYWLLHCHIGTHLETGMALILKVGEDEDIQESLIDF